MICELCGSLEGKGFRVRLEGTVINACARCAAGKEVVGEVEQPKPKKKPSLAAPAVAESFDVVGENELVDEFGPKIKAARERIGLTQEELGKAINESHSVVHRMELGRYEPSEAMARKIERKLGIRILTKHQDVEVAAKAGGGKEVTLGDVVVLRKKGK
jgi:putative transcription factor